MDRVAPQSLCRSLWTLLSQARDSRLFTPIKPGLRLSCKRFNKRYYLGLEDHSRGSIVQNQSHEPISIGTYTSTVLSGPDGAPKLPLQLGPSQRPFLARND
jgi:hypothetical protein